MPRKSVAALPAASMGAYLSQLFAQVWTLTARGMTTQIGVQAWAQRVSDLVGAVAMFFARGVQRRWHRMVYQDFILLGEDALMVMRWIRDQPGAQVSSSFTVEKNVAVQLQQDAPSLEDAKALERSLEFKPNLEVNNVRLTIGGTFAWFRTSVTMANRMRMVKGPRRRLPVSSSTATRSAKRKGNVSTDATISAVSGFDGLSKVAASELQREEENREKAFIHVRFLNWPWHRKGTAKSLLARVLQEGKQLQRQDDTRFATYKISVDTDACAYLMRWIRSQPKALQPTQMRIADGDGIKELTLEEQRLMHLSLIHI